jgi:hypothetical protein
MEQMSKKKKIIVSKFIKACEKLGRVPTIPEFRKSTGITKDMIRHHFDTLNALIDVAKEMSPKTFERSLDIVFNKENVKRLKVELKQQKRFVITTAISGCSVNKKFLDAINLYCSENDAKLLVLLNMDPAANISKKAVLDPLIPKESVVASEIKLNNNLFVSTVKLSAKQINPLTGLSRLGQRDGSFIYASPKQALKLVATSNNGFPHAVMTTGAVTESDYNTDRYMSERTAYIANKDHCLGAIIVEIEDDRHFHYRQVQFMDGYFADLNKAYYPNKTEFISVKGLVLGDIHSGETDLSAMKAWKELTEMVNPEYILLHDVFNGKTINHHIENNVVERYKATQEISSLQEEIRVVAEQLQEISSWNADESKLVVVQSNHDSWLNDYLNEGKYCKDPVNHGYALKLANAMVNEGKNPLSEGILWADQALCRVKFLDQDEDFKLLGVQLSCHGSQGPNGTKGTIMGMEKAYGNCITAHTHTPEILRGAWCVGTSSLLRLYNHGASSWMHCSCILHKNGSKQLVNAIEGSWKI